MTARSRPLPDRIEVATPRLAAVLARFVGRLPEPARRRALQAAFDRARDAFNRGDLEAVFALFAENVEYSPPPPLHDGPPLHGRAAVFDFWRDVHNRYDTSTIANLTIQESAPGRFVRRARLQHRSTTGKTLSYTIIQTTHLAQGRVVRQINLLDPAPRTER